MSALCLLEFSSKKLKFAELNNLANEVMANALLNNYAVFFNDDYARQILKPVEYRHTILISSNFFDRNADELFDVTGFVSENEANFKERFIDKFSFLDQLFSVLLSYRIEDLSIYFTDYSEVDFNEYMQLEVNTSNVVEKLYKTFIELSQKTGYTFPNIIFRIKKS